jgi:hypothetical protein
LGKYALHDPVRLIDHTERVIFRIEMPKLQILLANGTARSVTLDAVAVKRQQPARDSNGKLIQVGETIYAEHEGEEQLLFRIILEKGSHSLDGQERPRSVPMPRQAPGKGHKAFRPSRETQRQVTDE